MSSEDWVRRIRAILTSGVIWAGLWALLGAVVGVILGLGTALPLSAQLVFEVAAASGLTGGIAGISFGALLSSTYGRRTLADVSLVGAASVGLVGGLITPGLLGLAGLVSAPTGLFAMISAGTAGVGALVATAIVALARRADRPALGSEPGPSPLLPGSQ